jgi:hypothetical protein
MYMCGTDGLRRFLKLQLFDFAALLVKLPPDLPVLVIHGEADQIIPFECSQVRALRQRRYRISFLTPPSADCAAHPRRPVCRNRTRARQIAHPDVRAQFHSLFPRVYLGRPHQHVPAPPAAACHCHCHAIDYFKLRYFPRTCALQTTLHMYFIATALNFLSLIATVKGFNFLNQRLSGIWYAKWGYGRRCRVNGSLLAGERRAIFLYPLTAINSGRVCHTVSSPMVPSSASTSSALSTLGTRCQSCSSAA